MKNPFLKSSIDQLLAHINSTSDPFRRSHCIDYLRQILVKLQIDPSKKLDIE